MTEGTTDGAIAVLLERLASDALTSADAVHVTLSVSGDASVEQGQVPTLALIVLECVNNAIEHAFPAKRTGRLWIRIDSDRAGLVVAVEDDGIGCGASVPETSLGTTLCRRLAKAIGGRFSLLPRLQGGTRAELTIGEPAAL